MTALQRESSFNPLAVNLTDSNARATRALAADGLPAQASRGGLQMIPSTFGAFHQAGTSHNMYEPVADICAAMNYVVHDPKYGVSMDASNLGKVAQFNPHSRGGGY
jgi:SLT domain-containing protein